VVEFQTMPRNPLDSSAQYLKGVGPRISAQLKRLGVDTVRDLVFFFPRDYVDRSAVKSISSVQNGETVLVTGSVSGVSVNRTRRGFTLVKAAVHDSTGSLSAVWFNQPFMQRSLRKGVKILVSGKAQFNSYTADMEISVREWELLDDASKMRKLVPKYPLTEGLFQKRVRKVIELMLPDRIKHVHDPLPDAFRARHGLQKLREAVMGMHFPASFDEARAARKRLAFDDFFFFQLGMLLRRRLFKKRPAGDAVNPDGGLVGRFTASLPFRLTSSQEKVINEIFDDLKSGNPMSRLLQGDVGSGKTIVAVIAALAAVQSGLQVAVMAPTEILAEQHFSRIEKLVGPQGVRVSLLTGGSTGSKKSKLRKNISEGDVDIVAGTHALIENKVKFKRLGLVIIDEQHRFGVMQRKSLIGKGRNPHLLFMTATPIPRSLALTLYGDLDRSVIDEMPPGRTPVQTVRVDGENRGRAYEFMRKEMNSGRQVFLVCPLIEESEKLDLKAARMEAETLQKDVFPEFKVGLMHGRLKPGQKDGIMKDFRLKKLNILVSTTVIEVGIDVPNATIMFIEHAERFGLSQLHQLRGRIGRGSEKSYCLIASDARSEDGRRRISAMLKTSDGFKIAEEDLKIRGPGDFCGTRQAGLPAFRIADIISDEPILRAATAAANDVLREDPELELAGNLPLKEEILLRHGKFLELGALN